MEQIWVLTRTEYMVSKNGRIAPFSEESGIGAFASFESGKKAFREELGKIGATDDVSKVFDDFLTKVEFGGLEDERKVWKLMQELLAGEETHKPLLQEEYLEWNGVSYNADTDIPMLFIGANSYTTDVPVLQTNAIVMDNPEYRYEFVLENWNGKAHKYFTVALTPLIPE